MSKLSHSNPTYLALGVLRMLLGTYYKKSISLRIGCSIIDSFPVKNIQCVEVTTEFCVEILKADVEGWHEVTATVHLLKEAENRFSIEEGAKAVFFSDEAWHGFFYKGEEWVPDEKTKVLFGKDASVGLACNLGYGELLPSGRVP